MTILSSIGIFGTSGYMSAFIFMLMLYFFMLSSTPLLDTLSIRVAERAHATYGSVRMWGSVGFMLLSLSSGFLLTALGGMHNLSFLYWTIWVLPMLLLLLLRDEKGKGDAVVSLRAFGSMLRNKQFIWFFYFSFS